MFISISCQRNYSYNFVRNYRKRVFRTQTHGAGLDLGEVKLCQAPNHSLAILPVQLSLHNTFSSSESNCGAERKVKLQGLLVTHRQTDRLRWERELLE